MFRILENAKDMPAYDPNVLPMPLIEVTDEEEGEGKEAEWIEKNWTHLGLQEMLAKRLRLLFLCDFCTNSF